MELVAFSVLVSAWQIRLFFSAPSHCESAFSNSCILSSSLFGLRANREKWDNTRNQGMLSSIAYAKSTAQFKARCLGKDDIILRAQAWRKSIGEKSLATRRTSFLLVRARGTKFARASIIVLCWHVLMLFTKVRAKDHARHIASAYSSRSFKLSISSKFKCRWTSWGETTLKHTSVTYAS